MVWKLAVVILAGASISVWAFMQKLETHLIEVDNDTVPHQISAFLLELWKAIVQFMKWAAPVLATVAALAYPVYRIVSGI